MAVHRLPVRCQTCQQILVLRIVIAGGEQPFVFACPHCETEEHGRFYAQPEGPYELRSDDLLPVRQEPDDALTVAIATDLPVHLSFIGVPLGQAAITPFIHLAQVLGGKAMHEVMGAVDLLRARRHERYPALRRAAGFWARRDMAGVRNVLVSMPGGAIVDWSKQDFEDVFERGVASLYEAFEVPGLRAAAAEEVVRILARAKHQHPDELRSLFTEYDGGPLDEHRQRLVQVAFGALEDVDALYPALWVERMEGQVDLAQYRVMRDDFTTRKSGYQDLFELGSRSLAFAAPVANLALRGDLRAYADNTSRTPYKARKEKAFSREPWLADFPVASRLYGAMSRHTRNDIGHTLVRHDVARGVLVYEDGTEEGYLEFLADALHAVRLSHYLLDVVFLIEKTRVALVTPGQSGPA